MLISNPYWKSCDKTHQKKVIRKTSLTNMSKSEKWNSAFFDTFFDFFKTKFFLGNISTFFKLWLQMRRKRLKKTENLFYECILEFNYATIIKGFA
jgi:hypothetical protein